MSFVSFIGRRRRGQSIVSSTSIAGSRSLTFHRRGDKLQFTGRLFATMAPSWRLLSRVLTRCFCLVEQKKKRKRKRSGRTMKERIHHQLGGNCESIRTGLLFFMQEDVRKRKLFFSVSFSCFTRTIFPYLFIYSFTSVFASN